MTGPRPEPGEAPLSLSELRLPDIRRRARQGRRSALAKACAASPGARIHDAMAGWGTDALVLASLGCHVHMSERHPRIYPVLVARAVEFTHLAVGAGGGDGGGGGAGGATGKLTWALEDARARWLEKNIFDVIYLDPMFGAHPKTALPARHMQVLAKIVGDSVVDDIPALLKAARRAAISRVVIKRRGDGACIARPDWQIRARNVRFDVYRADRGGA